MNYFEALAALADRLDNEGQRYLNGKPFIENKEVMQRIFDAANERYENGERSDLVEQAVLDYYIPYTMGPWYGSLLYAIGSSAVARDACLRGILEYLEGRDKELFEIPTVADPDEALKMAESTRAS